MAKIIKTTDVKDDVAKALSFRKSGLDEVEEEEIETTEIPEEEVEEEVEEIEEEETEEEAEEEIDYKTLFEKEREDKLKLVENLTKPPAEEEVKEPNSPVDVSFIGESDLSDESFEDVIATKESFIKTLNEFGNKVRTKTTDEMLNLIPEIVTSITSTQIQLNEMNRSFYEDNKDLLPLKKVVGKISDDLIRENGINDIVSYKKLLDELPEIVRKELNLEKPNPKKAPKVVKPKGQRPTRSVNTEDFSTLESDIKKSLKFLKKRKQ